MKFSLTTVVMVSFVTALVGAIMHVPEISRMERKIQAMEQQIITLRVGDVAEDWGGEILPVDALPGDRPEDDKETDLVAVPVIRPKVRKPADVDGVAL